MVILKGKEEMSGQEIKSDSIFSDNPSTEPKKEEKAEKNIHVDFYHLKEHLYWTRTLQCTFGTQIALEQCQTAKYPKR